jgi:hypothetical protein
MINLIRISAAAILIVGAGIIHGSWTDRWGPSPALAALAARFESVPMVIGDWKATAHTIGARERAMAGASAWLSRVYTNPGRGVSISVLLLGGLPGNIATHTPDACYPGVGFTLTAPSPYTYRYGADGSRPAGFQSAVATRGGTNPSTLRIFWSWNASKEWAAPDDPRWKFAAEPTLCKLYIIRETAGAIVEPGVDPCDDFLSLLLPELDRNLFPTPSSSPSRL